MIECIDKSELEKFLRGKLDSKRMLIVDRHIAECNACRSQLASLPEFAKVSAAFGTMVIGADGCPDYEELSAFLDSTLDEVRTRIIAAHVNTCELCERDLERMRELRSQALLREKVIVRPGMTLRRSASKPSVWKRVFVGTMAVVALVWITVTLIGFGLRSGEKQLTAKKMPSSPVIEVPKAVHKTPPVPRPKSDKPILAQKKSLPRVVTSKDRKLTAVAESKVVLRDGNYRVVEKNGKLVFAEIDGTVVKTPLEARIMAAVEEKLRTGRIKLAEPIRVAMNTTLRDQDGYTPPPTAPTPISPDNKIVLTDRPTLVWSKVDLAESYRVIVKTDDGNVVFEQETDRNSVTVTKPLQRGSDYSWQVGVRFSAGDEWTNSRAVRFRVLSDTEYAVIQKIKSQMPGSHLALGVAYEAFGLYDEAAAEYRKLARANPNSTLARDMLRKTVESVR